MSLYDVSIMTLRGVSASIFDMFFLFTIFIGYLTLVRFNQINIYAKNQMKSPKEMIIEMIVQGIVMGVVFSLAVTFIGIPIIYTDYLYFILPLSVLLGYNHVKYTNVIYSAMIMGVLSLLLNGQVVLDRTLPNINLNMSGLLGIVGILVVVEGVLLFLLRRNDMIPIVAKKNGQLIIGFAIQRFWPIPVAVLVATDLVASGETIPMPDWWPMLGNVYFTDLKYVLLLLPLMFIISHGSISFTKSPKGHIKGYSITLIISGIILLLGAFVLDRFPGLSFLGLLLMFAASFGVDWYNEWGEEHDRALFPKTPRGVRVLHVEQEGLGRTLGFEMGDLIKEINGIEVTTLYQMQAIIKDRHPHFKMKVQKANGTIELVEFDKKEMILGGLQLVYLPDEPEKVYDYDQVKRMGMMHMLKFHSMR